MHTIASISEQKVMRSGAGWYVGRSYIDEEYPNLPMPYSRDSGYYSSEKEAEEALSSITLPTYGAT